MSQAESIRYRARWILPVTSPPVEYGWVDVEDGSIAGVGGKRDGPARPRLREVDLGRVAVMPGLVNAHTHLELSMHRGAVPPAETMPAWARDLMRRAAAAGERIRTEHLASAVAEMRRAGTALVGDVGNTLASLPALDAGPVGGVVFHEMLGFDVAPDEAEALVRRLRDRVDGRRDGRVRLRGAAHAPYSVSPALFRALAAGVPGPRSVHLAESREEGDFLRDGGGAWRRILEARGRWAPGWEPPGAGPVDYLDALGWLRRDTLAVHGVQLTAPEIGRLAEAGATIVTCPRSNRWTGAGTPPARDFYASGARIAVGTDSLASAPDLNLFGELAELRRLAPDVPASRLLRSATIAGAGALGWGRSHGAIEPGRRAALIAVDISGAGPDVEEYLLSGIRPEQIAWPEDLAAAHDPGPAGRAQEEHTSGC